LGLRRSLLIDQARRQQTGDLASRRGGVMGVGDQVTRITPLTDEFVWPGEKHPSMNLPTYLSPIAHVPCHIAPILRRRCDGVYVTDSTFPLVCIWVVKLG
jgi:hypothetical protein